MRAYKIAKRVGDIVVALLGMLVLSPLIMLIALAILLSMGRPVLFVQERPGYGGVPFKLRKFRTMRIAAQAHGVESDGVRLTRLGRILRSSSLDELPELWNVLIGDMSLVGPRPLLLDYLGVYTPEQMRRHDVPPGITGWAQVNGRNALDWDDRLALDVWYVDHRSLHLDIRILLKTVGVVIGRRGINTPGSVTSVRFDAGRRAGHGEETRGARDSEERQRPPLQE